MKQLSKMQLIIISGPSGSGKTTLSKQISEELKDAIIINTDNYYKTGIISQVLSKIIACYFDRKISFNFKVFKNDLDFILKNGFTNFSYKYDFKNKSIKKIYNKKTNIRYLIIEGIFGNEVLEESQKNKSILIKLNTSKQTCMKRVIKRDFIERGKSEYHSRRDFLKAWKLFHTNKKKKKNRFYLKEIVITKEIDLKLLIKNIIHVQN